MDPAERLSAIYMYLEVQERWRMAFIHKGSSNHVPFAGVV